ncbi:MAG: hypothetical protein A2104_02805 [Candidatus Melainabacteria bacterium GWF2_32_7]|nr:MAG: hypothetical protein A2104_02805 [Candidatus Melainabacteria bacterium GWF2_32_7]
MLNKDKPVEIVIDDQSCINCSYCASICPADYLISKNNKIYANENSPFGCIQCGHCMMNCPTNSIKIRGEGISENDIVHLSEHLPDFDAINSLFIKRRSIRKFKNQEIPKEIIDKIIQAASTAPISIPPSEVKILVINGFDKVQEFAEDLVKGFVQFQKIFNPLTLKLFKPIIGEVQYKLFKDFILPLAKITVDARKEGNDVLFYNAPTVVLFYGTELTDKEDKILASAHAAIAAESLGLGTCIIGSVPPLLEKDKKLKEKYGILKNEKPGMAFVLGYPDIKFKRGIQRRFKAVRYY